MSIKSIKLNYGQSIVKVDQVDHQNIS